MSGAVRKEMRIGSHGGIALHLVRDVPRNPTALIVFAHGASEYARRYDHVSDYLCDCGYAVFRYDLRGHGSSGGVHGDLEDYRHLLEDHERVVGRAQRDWPHLPLFMLGHSVGAAVTMLHSLRYERDVRGHILVGLPAAVPQDARGVIGAMLPFVSSALPAMRLKNRYGKYVCSIAAVRQAYDEDPEVLKDVTLRFCHQVTEAIKAVREGAPRYAMPCLILHGSDDRIALVEGAEFFYQAIASQDKQLKIYPGLYHELFNERIRKKVLEEVRRWIEGRR